MMKSLNILFALLACLFMQITARADVNVLIIGSEYDTTDSLLDTWWDCNPVGASSAFSAAKVKTELTNILSNAGLGTVNVQLEERIRWNYHTYYDDKRTPYYPGIVECYNLETWFRWPYPADIETTTRWPNLRGESTQWDYVILIGDPYTIEYQPGVYAQGVASIAAEVAKGASPAEVVLLMPWPALGSSSTVEHYKEVVYRVGRSGGHKVAPAGLAWQDLKGASRSSPNPDNDGAYIAAASLFSRIWGQSASASSYTYTPDGDAMADAVYSVVTSSIGAQHYSGKFDFQSPYKMSDDKRRQVSSSRLTSSTELGFHNAAIAAEQRSKVDAGGGTAWRIERDDGIFGRAGQSYLGFGFVYQNNISVSDLQLAELSRWDLGLAGKMIDHPNGDNLRLIPRRFMWAQFHQEYPDANPMGGSPHVSDNALRMSGTYIYTLFSGRCPMDPKPNPVTPEWYADKIGYETAWRMGRCQTRAPGFKVMPSSATRYGVSEALPEIMAVQFILPPQQDVVVNVSISDSSAATVSPATLTFTPANYDTPQQVVVTAKAGASVATLFNVEFNTVSDDEVYNALDDSWSYFINAAPVVTLSSEENPVYMDDGATAASTVVTADAVDADGDALSYSWTQVSGPGTVIFSSTTATSPTVTFSEAGNYILRCSVTDSYTPAVDAEIAIDVRPETIVLRDPENPADTVSGNVEYELYDGLAGMSTVDDLGASSGGALLDTGLVSFFRFRGVTEEEEDQFGYIYRGYIDVPASGFYTFSLNSSGGSVLWIGDTEVVDNDGLHDLQEKSGAIGLKRGKHAITVKYFFNSAGNVPFIEAYWAGPNMNKQAVLWDVLYHVSPTPVDDIPFAVDQYVTTRPDTATNITIVATDADGDSVAYLLESQPVNGTLSGTVPNLTYTPDPGFSGSDSFTFKATDGPYTSSIATVEIAVNTPPIAFAGTNKAAVLGAAAPWTPTEIATEAWYDASTATINAGTVSIVNGGSGGGTISGPAALAVNGIGNLQAVQFNGTSQYLTGNYTNTSTTLTAFFVGKSQNTSQIAYAGMMSVWENGQANDWNNIGSAVLFSQNNNTANSIYTHRNAALSSANGTLTSGFLADVVFNGSTHTLYLNGSPASSVASSGSFNAGKLQLGARWQTSTFNGWWNGNFGEAIICNTALSLADRQKIQGYLAWKWGLEASLPSGHPYKSAAPGAASVAVTLTDASVSDDDAGDTLSQNWGLVSKPAGASGPTFSSTTEVNPTVTFTATGTYILRLTANDGMDTHSDEVTINIYPQELGRYWVWADGSFTHALTDNRIDADPDGDGLKSLLEFAFGTDPTASSGGALATDGSAHGQPKVAPEGAEMELYFLRRKDHGTSGSVSYRVEFSSDLATFYTSAVAPSFVADSSSDADYEVVKVPFPGTLPDTKPARFGRIVIAPSRAP